jgi:hypothetical protein
MPSSGMLRHVPLVRTDGSEECIGSINRVRGINELGTSLALSSNRIILRSVRRLLFTTSVGPSWPILVTLMKEAARSSEMSILTRATQR